MGETIDDERQDQRRKDAPDARPAAGPPLVESLTVRPAREADRAAVFAFCARTWGDDGDYIPYVWDEWLADMADGRGVLLVAAASVPSGQEEQLEQVGRPVGLLHVRMVSDDEAWIEGVRVDPTERRQGVGRSLVSRGLVAARERGATVARFFTDAGNVASQRLFGGFGFTRVAEVLAFRAPALTFSDTPNGETPADAGADATGTSGVDVSPGASASSAVSAQANPAQVTGQENGRALAAAGLADDLVELRLTTPGVESAERIWEWLVQSNLTPFNGGLELRNWTARALTEATLRADLASGNVWLLEGWDTILALAITDDAPADEDDVGDDEENMGDTVGAEDAAPGDATSGTGTDGGASELGQAEPHRHAPGSGALNVRYLDGSADGLSRLCLTLREVAGQRGRARVNLWLPDLLILRDAMAGAGYEQRGDEAMYVYARAL